MVRLEDWPQRLTDYFVSVRDAVFQWGTNDCALFACNAVLAMTDVDLAVDFRGTYSNAGGAAIAMRDFAGAANVEAVADVIAERFDIPEISPKWARRGDILLVDTDLGPALAVVDLDGIHGRTVAPVQSVSFPVKLARRAWRI